MHKTRAVKRVRIGSVPFFRDLRAPGLVFMELSEDHEVEVVACEGFQGDWAAYFQRPDTPFGMTAEYGSKLPEDVAAKLFPEWAERLKWRE